MMKTRILLFLQLLFCFQINAQDTDDHPLRVEIPARSDEESYKILACGSEGVLLYFKSVEKEKDTLTKWYFSFYDADLKHKWLKAIAIPDYLVLSDADFTPGVSSFCFLTGSKEKNALSRFLVIRINMSNTELAGNQGAMPEKYDAAGFHVSGNKAYLGFTTRNGNAMLRVISLNENQIFDLDCSPGVDAVLTGFHVDTTSGNIYCYLKRYFAKNKYEYFITTIDPSGKIINEILINDGSGNGGSENYILDLKSYTISGNEIIAYGAYRTGIKKNQEKNNLLAPATGIYFVKINDGKVTKSVFTNFLSLRNGVFPAKSDVTSLKKKANRKNREITDYSLDYSALVHPLYNLDNQYVMLAELFTPQYHMENYTNFDYYGRPSSNSYRVFDGYRFNTGMIIGFDDKGNILWDNGIEILNLISFELSPKVSLSVAADSSQVLSYLSEGKIGYKVLKNDRVLEKLDFSPLEMMNPEDKLLTETKSNMVYWYDNNYLCSGYQEIKNINASENRKRIVFYITKVKFD